MVGPTAIGKSRLAFEIAVALSGEIVVADSRQVYQRLDIATNKPPPEHRLRVRYHMIDFVDPASSFNAAQYVEGAKAAIEDILARGRIAIVEGGTMLYVDALTKGFSLTGVPPDPELRSKLERMDIDSLRARLLELDPDPDRRRGVTAIPITARVSWSTRRCLPASAGTRSWRLRHCLSLCSPIA